MEKLNNKKKRILYIYLILLACNIALAFLDLSALDPSIRLLLANEFQCFILISIAVLLGRCAIRWLKGLGYAKCHYARLALYGASICLLGALILVFFFRAENDIKVYDSTTYWIRVIEDRARIAASIPDYLLNLRDTLSHEYTHLPAFALQPLSYLFGISFTGYCLSVFFIYYIPACFLLTILALRIVSRLRKEEPGMLAFAVCFFICVISPPMFWPLVNGYLDVAGVMLAALILNITFEWDGVQFSWKNVLILAALSLTLLLTRRWYAFYIVGFYAALGIVAVAELLLGHEFHLKKIGMIIANMGIIAGLDIAGIFLINPAIFTSFLGTDYSIAYEAFKSWTFVQSIWSIVITFGFLWIVTACLGFIVSLKTKESRFSSIRVMLAMIIASALFLSTQDMGPHHRYLTVPTIVVFIGVFAVFLIEKATKTQSRLIGVCCVALTAVNFALGYIPAFYDIAAFSQPLTTALYSYPKQNENIEAFHNIVADLNGRTARKVASVYVVGEGAVMAPEYLRRIHLPEEIDAAPFAMVNNTADMRDGFPSQLFMADYILVADPFSTDFQSIQQVSYQAYDMLLNDGFMQEYYTLAATYPLHGHEALLYQKTRPTEQAAIDALKERLAAQYPEVPFIYEPNYFLSLVEFDERMIYYGYWDNTLVFMKTGSDAIQFSLQDTVGFSSLSFGLRCDVPGLTLQVENESGELYRAEILQETQQHTIDIAGSRFLKLAITDTNSGSAIETNIIVSFNKESLMK